MKKIKIVSEFRKVCEIVSEEGKVKIVSKDGVAGIVLSLVGSTNTHVLYFALLLKNPSGIECSSIILLLVSTKWIYVLGFV